MQDKSGSNSPVLLPSSGVRLLVVTGPRGGVEAGTTTTGRQLLNSRSTHCNPFPLILNGRRPLLKVSYYWGYCLSLLSLLKDLAPALARAPILAFAPALPPALALTPALAFALALTPALALACSCFWLLLFLQPLLRTPPHANWVLTRRDDFGRIGRKVFLSLGGCFLNGMRLVVGMRASKPNRSNPLVGPCARWMWKEVYWGEPSTLGRRQGFKRLAGEPRAFLCLRAYPKLAPRSPKPRTVNPGIGQRVTV